MANRTARRYRDERDKNIADKAELLRAQQAEQGLKVALEEHRLLIIVLRDQAEENLSRADSAEDRIADLDRSLAYERDEYGQYRADHPHVESSTAPTLRLGIGGIGLPVVLLGKEPIP